VSGASPRPQPRSLQKDNLLTLRGDAIEIAPLNLVDLLGVREPPIEKHLVPGL
jgi:hypothetical protein